MPSTRESALQGLKTALDTLATVTLEVKRNVAIPTLVPADGLLIVRDGEPGEPETVLSPVTYSYEHEAEIEALVHSNTLDGDLDTLLALIPGALNADKTLGGVIDILEIRTPEFLDEPVEGADNFKGATVPVTLFYDTTSPL